MRLFLALVSGFALTLSVFAAGAILATLYLAVPAQEHDGFSKTAAVWSEEPVRVAYAPGQSPAEPRATDATDASAAAGAIEENDGGIDLVNTAAAVEAPQGEELADNGLPDTAGQRAAEAEMLAAAHVDWCHDRYRSYRPEDNSYRPYGGGRTFCVSPYLEQLAAPDDVFQVSLEDDSAASADDMHAAGTAALDLTDEHIRHCFDRYRSYRPQDNSYQPYGGGSRRQCM